MFSSLKIVIQHLVLVLKFKFNIGTKIKIYIFFNFHFNFKLNIKRHFPYIHCARIIFCDFSSFNLQIKCATISFSVSILNWKSNGTFGARIVHAFFTHIYQKRLSQRKSKTLKNSNQKTTTTTTNSKKNKQANKKSKLKKAAKFNFQN